MAILNLTQHAATPEQIAAGVVDPPDDLRQRIRELLTFDEVPTPGEIEERATRLARIAADSGYVFETAMIGGAPWLMPALERALVTRGIAPVYAFSAREVVEEQVPDGSVRKVAVFRHRGFVLGLPPNQKEALGGL
jgi:hypothetical protein